MSQLFPAIIIGTYRITVIILLWNIVSEAPIPSWAVISLGFLFGVAESLRMSNK